MTPEEFIEMMTPRMFDRDPKEEIQKVFALIAAGSTAVIVCDYVLVCTA